MRQDPQLYQGPAEDVIRGLPATALRIDDGLRGAFRRRLHARWGLKHLGHGISEVRNSPDADGLPNEMKELLAKIDDTLADKRTVASDSDLNASDRSV